MYVIVDNFDSFTYNLKAYFEELGKDIAVIRSDAASIREIEALNPQGIIISPGPKRPADADASIEVVRYFKGKLPILGVCLGHQVLGYTAGAVVEKGRRPMHGKVTEIETTGQGLFAGLPKKYPVTRYHSLIVKGDTLSEEYRIDAWTEEGDVMALSHKELPIYGVQFHPEAVLTKYGHELLENFCRICEEISMNKQQREEKKCSAEEMAERHEHMEENKDRKILELDQAPAIADIFTMFAKEPDAVFLDSSLKNELGRYSIIGIRPYKKVSKTRKGCLVDGKLSDVDFEVYVKEYLQTHVDHNATFLPIVSGAIGYFTYDYGRERMGIETRHPLEVDIPEAVLTFYDAFIIEDTTENKTYLVTNGQSCDAEELQKQLEQRIRQLSEELKKNMATEAEADADAYNVSIAPNFEKKEYMDTVDDMIRYIYEGDIYIANMTQHLTVKSEKEPYQVFKYLREHNPSPFGGYMNYEDYQIVSASPERFLRMQDGHVETRPIKGTRKRGATPEEDAALKQELQDSGKDQSELLMIVDLERNDLNRVCVPGSVEVTELFSVETYATVFHLVSNVEGDLRPDLTVMDLIESAFPGGSITGAPKYRAMEIIDELEHSRRNLYTGSIGYLTLDGNCDFNIVIRTALHKDGNYYLGVGGGITAESELEFEYEETLQKAKAVVEALGGNINEDSIG